MAVLAPLDPTASTYQPSLRTGRREQWSARTADGVWAFDREEDRGTTWTATHLLTGRRIHDLTSLRQCRECAASGWLLAELDRQDRRAAAEAARIAELAADPTVCTLHGDGWHCDRPRWPGTDRCREHRPRVGSVHR